MTMQIDTKSETRSTELGSRPSISLVVPTYNEHANIPELVRRAGKVLAACSEVYELIIVDDDSPDGTADEVRRLQADFPWLSLLVRKHERDLSTAVIAGWRIAKGEVLGCMDGDLQHPPELLPVMFDALLRNRTDVVVASRHLTGGGVSKWNLARRFISWTATLMATCILPGTLGKVRDPMSGFFLLRRAVVDRAPLNPLGYKILLEVLAKGDFSQVQEVPFIFEERIRGGSKLGLRTVLNYLLHLLRISVETGECWRITKFAFVGLSGAVVNFVALRWLVEKFGWSVPWAAIAGAVLAIVNNFIWNDHFTFAETGKKENGLVSMLHRFVSFLMLSAMGVGINVGLIWMFLSVFGWNRGASIVLAIGVAGLWNFVANSNVTWQVWWNRKLLSPAANPAPLLETTSTEGANNAREDLLVYSPCNLCHSTQFKVFYRGTANGSLSEVQRSAQVFRCTSNGHGDFTEIVQCCRCGLMCENPREPEGVVEQQYEMVEDPTYEREAEGRVRTFSKLLDEIARYRQPGRILDIGCYTGVFLQLAKQRGWEACGVEPSKWAAGKARKKGLTVFNGPLDEVDFPPASFDVITLWDVIEHLHDPLRDLRKIASLLRPDGLFALSTMDVGSLFAKLTARHWPWHMRMHLYYFTPGTISRMCQSAGLQVIAVEPHKRIVSLRYFIEKAASQIPGFTVLGQWIGLPFKRRYVSVDFGDIMNVFAIPCGASAEVLVEEGRSGERRPTQPEPFVSAPRTA